MKANSPVIKIESLRFPWVTRDPFIFCSYHMDNYPGGNNEMGPGESLAARNTGHDFSGKDGWSMYHGSKVPGFPVHPHCGFETVTIVLKGMVDHTDSAGASGRYGDGDVQWLTIGKGVQHAEMFPLLNKDKNTLELFQIWLNLPAKSKKVDAYYKMLWNEDIPSVLEKDSTGRSTVIKLVAGSYKDTMALSPTPDSWAADPGNYVLIMCLSMEAKAEFIIPSADRHVNRTLYFYRGESFKIGETEIKEGHLIDLDPSEDSKIINGSEQGFYLLLQGKPIEEPVVQYGPFVANSREELQQAINDFQKTQFGGWPWDSSEPVFAASSGRFSQTPDGNKVVR